MNSVLSKYTNVNNPGSFLGLTGFKKNNKFKLRTIYESLKNIS